MDSSLVFAIGNGICLLGTMLLLVNLIRRRQSVRDLDPTGSTLTFIAVGMFAVGWLWVSEYLSFALTLPTVGFWGLAACLSWQHRIGKRKKILR